MRRKNLAGLWNWEILRMGVEAERNERDGGFASLYTGENSRIYQECQYIYATSFERTCKMLKGLWVAGLRAEFLLGPNLGYLQLFWFESTFLATKRGLLYHPSARALGN